MSETRYLGSEHAHELSLKIGYGLEHVAGNHVALDLGEPKFNLVEPRRIGGSEVQMNVAVGGEEFFDPLEPYSNIIPSCSLDETMFSGTCSKFP